MRNKIDPLQGRPRNLNNKKRRGGKKWLKATTRKKRGQNIDVVKQEDAVKKQNRVKFKPFLLVRVLVILIYAIYLSAFFTLVPFSTSKYCNGC